MMREAVPIPPLYPKQIIPFPAPTAPCSTGPFLACWIAWMACSGLIRSEEHTSELQSRFDLVCRLLLEKKNFVRVIKNGIVLTSGVSCSGARSNIASRDVATEDGSGS